MKEILKKKYFIESDDFNKYKNDKNNKIRNQNFSNFLNNIINNIIANNLINENKLINKNNNNNTNNKYKYELLMNKEDAKDKKNEFESELNAGNKNNIDKNKNRHKLIQKIEHNEIYSINYNFEKRKVFQKLINKNYNNDDIADFQIPFEKEDIFNEYDKKLIEKIIQNIHDDKEDENFEIQNVKPPKYADNLSKEDNISSDQYIVKELINICKQYIYLFFEQFSKCNLQFSNIAFCFILDCSLYLGYTNKFIYLMIILSILKTIQMLNIKFCILLSGDDNFKVVIKSYEENVNYDDLIERIYETYIIKRYRNNLVKSVQIAVEYLKYNEKCNHLFLIFSDCLDDSIIQFTYWKNKIFYNIYNSFIFFIETSHQLTSSQENIIIDKWKNFERKANKSTKSKVKVINFSRKKIKEYNNNFNISDFLNQITIKENLDKDNKNNLIEQKKINIDYFDRILDFDGYKDNDKIYFFNADKQKRLNKKNLIKSNMEFDLNNKIKKKNIPEIKNHISKILKFHQDKSLIESVFYPNKATQKKLSTKGSEIDILSLILYTICPVQEPMIYLEDKGGMIRDYSITIIIDNSITCFNELNEKHSYLTIINLLKIVYTISVPSFDLIVTGGFNEKSNILIFNKPSVTIFKNDAIYHELLSLLSNPINNPDLIKAIKTTYNLKSKNKIDKESYIFILTDGLLHKKNEKEINLYLNLIQLLGIKVFGIGLGLYPYKAKELFKTLIYTPNPKNLLKGISIIFGKSNKTENELRLLSEKEGINIEELQKIFSQLEDNNKFVYKNLRKELNEIKQGDDILSLFCNKEKIIFDHIDFPIRNIEDGKDLEIYGEDILKSQKILMVMLWSYDLNKRNESPFVLPKYINEESKANGTCIKSAIEHFGLDNYVVVDYKSAIDELIKTNDKGECLYFSVWTFCGPQYPILPPIDGNKNNTDPYLVEEYINVLIEFWKNGGSLVFLAEGDPLNFQVNLFLEKIDFSKDEKPKFRISGEYYGDEVLKFDRSGKMEINGLFDKKSKKSYYKGIEIQRQSLSHNLAFIYEGFTISYAVDSINKKKITIKEKEKLNPFLPFSVNSEGGISTLIYEADQKGRGDIIIDCGFTKCFLNMKNTGTFRFIQNIAAWTARPEIIYKIEKKKPNEWRPKGIKYKVNYKSHYNGYLKYELKNPKEMKSLFAIDLSISTTFDLYREEVTKLLDYYFDEERGDIIYIWGGKKENISKEKLIHYFEVHHSIGLTYPSLIAQIIDCERKKLCKHLVIVTDGNVSKKEISEADDIMKKINYHFEYVSIYIIGNNGDMSVGVPFCRRTPNKTFMKKEKDNDFKVQATLTPEDINTLEEIEKIDNFKIFMDDYDKIKNAIQAECIGTSENKEIKRKLESSFEKILKNLKNEDKNNIDMELFNKRKNILLGMTQGSLLEAFSLENINAAINNYMENDLDNQEKENIIKKGNKSELFQNTNVILEKDKKLDNTENDNLNKSKNKILFEMHLPFNNNNINNNNIILENSMNDLKKPNINNSVINNFNNNMNSISNKDEKYISQNITDNFSKSNNMNLNNTKTNNNVNLNNNYNMNKNLDYSNMDSNNIKYNINNLNSMNNNNMNNNKIIDKNMIFNSNDMNNINFNNNMNLINMNNNNMGQINNYNNNVNNFNNNINSNNMSNNFNKDGLINNFNNNLFYNNMEQMNNYNYNMNNNFNKNDLINNYNNNLYYNNMGKIINYNNNMNNFNNNIYSNNMNNNFNFNDLINNFNNNFYNNNMMPNINNNNNLNNNN